jgi:hypothetical protein
MTALTLIPLFFMACVFVACGALLSSVSSGHLRDRQTLDKSHPALDYIRAHNVQFMTRFWAICAGAGACYVLAIGMAISFVLRVRGMA